MRMLFVNYEYPPLGGGGAIETRDLAEELAKHHEVHVLTTAYRDLPRREIQNNVTIHRVPVWARTERPTATLRSLVTFVPVAALLGIPLMRQLRPHILNAHFVVPSGIPAAFLAACFRRPLVLTLIGGDVYDPSKGVSPHRHAFLRAIIGLLLRRASAITAISRDTKERAMRYHRAPATIDVIPLGLVLPTFTPATRDALGWAATHFHAVTVGRLIPRKGYLDLLQGVAGLRHAGIVLHIVGDGPLGPTLRREASALGIADRVVFHGQVSDEEKFRLLTAADVYVSASLHEGFGICFLEAMAARLPIIATDTGGQTDFLVSGRNAILVPPHRPEQLTHALQWIMDDGGLRDRMRKENAAAVQEHLITATARRYEALFELVKEKGAA
jgi:glycosyltransferase involved in cell wall biosynthesis